MASVEPPAVEPAAEPAPGPSEGAAPGIRDLYRAVWDAVRGSVARRHLVIAAEITLVALWFVLRTRYGVESRPYLAWTVVAAVVALVSPTSGLVLLLATSPFYEPVSISRALGPRNILVGILGIGVILRLALGGWREIPRSRTLALGAVVAALTAVSAIHTLRDFDGVFGPHAVQMWLATIGGAMIVLLVAVWVARTGDVRPIVAAVIGCAIASVLSLIELAQPGSISRGSLAWIGLWKDFGARVTGIIPAPNAVATMLIVPACLALAATVQLRGRRRVAAIVATVPIAAAAVLTLSRSAIGGLYVTFVLFISRLRRRTAWVLLFVGVAVAVVSLPLFIQFRAGVQGVFETRSPLDWILGADEARVTAWGAAVRMWADAPLIGHGFLSYKALADMYGDVRLGSPHNEVLRLFAEEGLIGGVALIAFIISLVRELGRRRDWIGTGLLGGAISYWFAAMFNNPLLFIQVSAIAFGLLGFGLGRPQTAPVPMSSTPSSGATTAG